MSLFSLRRNINQIEDLSTRYQAARDAFEKHLPFAPKELFGELKQQLKATPPPRLAQLLEEYGERLRTYQKAQDKEMKEILKMLGGMAEQMAKRDKQFSVRFTGIAKKLRLLTSSQDLAEIKQRLAEEVTQFEKAVEETQQDSGSLLLRLQGALHKMDQRPSRDTGGLLGAEDAQGWMGVRMDHGVRFCVVWVGGPVAGFAERVTAAQEVATDDAKAFRWSESELLLLLERPLLEGVIVAEKLQKALQKRGLPGHASAAEFIRGETVESLLDRARGLVKSNLVKSI
jgi:hypothetical protein